MRVRPLDLVVAVVAVAATVTPVALTSNWVAIAVAVIASAPVLWIRTRTLRVALVLGVATTVLATVFTPPLVPAGPLVAIYVIAAEAPAFWRIVCVAVTAVGVMASLVLTGDDDFDTYRYITSAYFAAYALGTSARARRVQERAVADERAAATARERTRIARDMHDIITHSVGMMVVQAEAGPLVVHADPDRATAVFDTIAETGRAAIVSLREVVAALRTVGVGKVEDLVARTDKAILVIDGDPRPVPSEVDETVYRIVQEALTNVLRHADATRILVRLRWRDGSLGVDVVDDGRGPSGKRGGYGLIGMRERAAACGGTVHTGRGPGGVGFAVYASLPIG